MKKTVLSIIAATLISIQGFAQDGKKSFVAMFYNVENLFDTADAPGTRDEDFTASGEKNWTWDRYQKKLDDLSRVILSLPGKEMPALIGLAEVENRAVLEDLLRRRGLRRTDYRIVHEDGPDPRGIDCALLYNPELFKYQEHEYIPVEDPLDPEYLYRGILHVKGKGPEGSTLHIFVNHWKSRSGGVRETEKKRMFTAITLRKQLDLLLAREQDFKVIMMGDFNDEPTNRSLSNGLSAGGKRKNIYLGDHYNLHYDPHNLQGQGSYAYRGQWNMLDQIIVSYNLLNQEKGLSCSWDSGRILKEEWMLYESEKYGQMLPSATYGGPEYYGGPSDHLPVYVIFSY
jgi:endonuclease/exonuclease/phosphatase family metal-dependent hydrolase